MLKQYRFYIGIDTGVNTGFALWDKKERSLLIVDTIAIHEAMYRIKTFKEINPESGIKVRVEDARLRKWFGKNSNAKLQGAGSVKRDAKIWEDFLKAEKLDYEMVAPKNNKTKLSAEHFKKITGWQNTTNEHGRDGAMLVFGI